MFSGDGSGCEEDSETGKGVKLCSLKGCDRPVKCKALCAKHYGKLMVSGTLEYKWVPRPRESVLLRNANGEKQCIGCLEFKHESGFNKTVKASDGLSARCKKCANHLKLVKKWGESAVACMETGCYICGSTQGKICIDHDHTCCPGQSSCGKCVRGVLCMKCNHAIGLFNDKTDLMKRAVDYLDNWDKATPRANNEQEN